MARSRNGSNGPSRARDHGRDETSANLNVNLGGFLGKLGTVVEKLVDLAEAGENFSRTGEIKGLDPGGKLRGVYGLSIRSNVGGQGEREIKIEPFGNVRRQPSGETVVDDVREPLVDVYEEDDHVLVLAEIPGVSKKDVQLDLEGEQLTIRAQRGEKRYQKEVALPEAFAREAMRWDCNNGILRIRFQRQAPAEVKS